MRTRIFLNPSNNVLVGNYPADVEHIHVVLDSSIAAFSVQLPDVTQPEHKEFIFYNYPSSGAGNIVTLLPVTGQVMINTDVSHALNPGDTVSACADLRNRWLLTDVNAVTPDPLTALDTADVDLTLTGQQLSAETIGTTELRRFKDFDENWHTVNISNGLVKSWVISSGSLSNCVVYKKSTNEVVFKKTTNEVVYKV